MCKSAIHVPEDLKNKHDFDIPNNITIVGDLHLYKLSFPLLLVAYVGFQL
jgi:hypothetical protein